MEAQPESTYTPAERNYDRIEFEAVRKTVDPGFAVLHDELSKAYYEGTPYGTYGVLDKDTFDQLHALVEEERQLALEAENAGLDKPDPKLVSHFAEKMLDDDGNLTDTTRKEWLEATVAQRKSEGIDIGVSG